MPVQNGRDLSSIALGPALGRLLAAETDLSERLLAVIGRERILMEEPLAADAEDLLQHKLSLLQELQHTSQQRLDLMHSHGFDATPAGIAACSQACGNTPGIRKAFLQLAQLAQGCFDANQRLGLLLNRKAGFFARLLTNLADGGQVPLYQANGQSDPASVNLRHRLSI